MFVLAASFSMTPKKANAVPAFAQKYHYACSVCHTVFPNLNPFGRAFWRNGFRLPGTDGTPADATQISAGLSLPNPWPVPIMVEPIISYQHYTNENVSPSTDAFGAGADIVDAGAFPLYNPLFNSLSFYVHIGIPGGKMKQVFASLNGFLYGFGIPSHLFNLKLGQVTTASPYFYRQAPFYIPGGPIINGQGLAVGFDGEAGVLIHSRDAGFALYGTPGYHLWYKVTVTNDAGSGAGETNINDPQLGVGEADTNIPCITTITPISPPRIGGPPNIYSYDCPQVSNAIEYSYQLKEYMPTSLGQLEFGYYGATVAEPITYPTIHIPSIIPLLDPTYPSSSWTNLITVNGIDADLSNDVWELGATYMVQSDKYPYGNPSEPANNITLDGNVVGNSHSSNGYSTFEVYGRYVLPFMDNGIMLSADYSQFSWTHKEIQEAGAPDYYCPSSSTGFVDSSGLYQYGVYNDNSGVCQEGIQNAFAVQAEINLALNAHLYLGYLFTNESQDDTFGTGLDFAF